MNEKNELKKLEEEVSYLASALDAATNDYFNNIGVAKETEEIYEHLTTAWGSMDTALDLIQCLTKGATKLTGTKQNKPAPVLSEKTFRAMLRNMTPETTKKNLEILRVIFDKAKEVKDINADLIPTYAALLLIEYGKQAYKEEHGPAGPEGKEGVKQ